MKELINKLGNKWIIIATLVVFVSHSYLLYVSTNNYSVIILSLFFATIFNRVSIFIQKTEISVFSKVLYCITEFGIIFHYFAVLRQPTGFWDTWQVWDMSRYIFSDFGYMENIRQHIYNTHYEMAFPPLIPVLTNIINQICDIGVESTIFLSSIFALITISVFIKLGLVLKHNSIISVVASIAMCNSEYIQLYISGNTQILGFLIMLYIYCQICDLRNFGTITSFKCAFLAGLGLMNRFDFLSITPLVFLSIPILLIINKFNYKKVIAITFFSAIIIGVTISPWIIYSQIRFNKYFITDNGRRLFTVEDTRPNSFYCENEPCHTIKTNTKEWCVAFSKRIMTALKGGIMFLALKSLIFPLFIILLFLEIADGRFNYDLLKLLFFKKHLSDEKTLIVKHIPLIITVVICFLQEVLILFTGYEDERYHIPFAVMLSIILLVGISKTLKRYENISIDNFIKNRAFLFVLLLFIFGTGLKTNLSSFKKYIVGKGFSNFLKLDGNELAISNYLKDANCRLLLVHWRENSLSVPRFGALIGKVPNIISHSNLSEKNIESFIDTFAPEYLYSSIEQDNEIIRTKFNLKKTPYENLYKLEKEQK